MPGWSNAASGTLTDSYVTPKEAQQKLEAEQARIEEKVSQEKQSWLRKFKRRTHCRTSEEN